MRLATPLALLALAGALLLGCGSGSSTTSTAERGAGGGTEKAPAGATTHSCRAAGARTDGLRASGAGCAEARRVTSAWLRRRKCQPSAGTSRASCAVGAYRCLAAATDRGWSVSCAEPGRSVAFTFRRG
jgi:hypothetical protein